MTNSRIVCAAMLMDDGLIVPGIRHYSPEMREILKLLYGKGYHLRVKEQGFVDQMGNFLDRKNAWIVAERSGQILKDCSVSGTLFSENLY
jgi:hypothetical protein